MDPNAEGRSFGRLPIWAGGGAILALALLAYFPVLHGQLLWDDDHYLTIPELRSWHGLWRIWFEVGATQQYFPVLHSAFWVEHRLWGGAVIGYHLTNIILHAAAAGLLALIMRRLAIPGAGLAAMIFALHPVAVESVAWISEQKNTLSAVFVLAAALAYLRFDQKRTPPRYVGALALYLLALGSKTVTAPLPAVLLVIVWWQRGRLTWKRDVLPLIPWFGLGAAAGLFSAWVERSLIGARGADFALGFVPRLLVAGRLFWFYLGKLFWPVRLNLIYPRWTPEASAAGAYLYPLAAMALLAALGSLRRIGRGPLATLLIFAGLLFPVLGFLNIYWFIYSFAADHFQYLAALGIIGGVSAGWGRWRAGVSGPGPILVAALAAGAFGTLTWQRCHVFRDQQTLYRATLVLNPGSWMAENNLGNLLRDSGRVPEAIGHYERALRLRPDAVAHYNLGVALADAGKNREAISQYEEALRLRPAYPGVHYDLGLALADSGRLPEAIGHYQEALRLGLDLPEVQVNLGNALAACGRPAEAIARYQEALRLQPAMAEAQNNWGNVLLGSGESIAAESHFEEAIRLKPGYAQAHYNLGVALARTGRNHEAIAQDEEAIRLKPDYAEAEDNLGAALATVGRFPDAIVHYEKALRLKPNDPAVHYNLGLALRAVGRTAEAARNFEQSAQLKAGAP